MMLDIQSMAWPAVRLNEAVEILAQKTGFPLDAHLEAVPPPPIHKPDDRTLGDWIEGAAGRLGLEAEAVSTTYTDVGRMVHHAGPALLALPDHPQSGFLVIYKARRSRVSVITPELDVRHIRPAIIRAILTEEIEAPLRDQVDRLLATTGVPPQRRARARQAILDEQLGEALIEGCWLLRQLPGANFWSQIRRARLPRYVAIIAAATLRRHHHGGGRCDYRIAGRRLVDHPAGCPRRTFRQRLVMGLVPGAFLRRAVSAVGVVGARVG
jgi:ATP-binding cassette subfamily B protein